MCSVGAAGLVLSGVMGLSEASNQRAIGQYNSALARREAQQAEEIGRVEEQRARSRMDRLISRQRASLAARGVRLDSASAERLGAEAAEERSVEAAAQRFRTGEQVTALNSEAQLAEARGNLGFMTGLSRTAAGTITRGLELWPELAGA